MRRTAHAPFPDRDAAGVALGERLRARSWHDPVVLGLPRGGIPVAAGVAAALGAPLDVAVVRKIGAPGRPELGVGAVTPDAPPYYDLDSLDRLGLTVEGMREEAARQREQARRRAARYREAVPPVPVADRDVVLVDDGLATGVTARAALARVRADRPRRLVFAAPVCAALGRVALQDGGAADDVVCLLVPTPFGAVGRWYVDFTQTDDAVVIELLTRSRRP
jgi:predicted phosphoribosyltransferase